MDERAARRALVSACRRLAEAGLVCATEGNLSAKIAPNRLLATPAGAFKGDLHEEQLVVTDMGGAAVDGGTPSSELPMHLAIYAVRRDVQAIVHAHPPTATGFACAGEGLTEPILSEVLLTVGRVPLVPFRVPGTQAMGEAVAQAIQCEDALLLANHGAVAVGDTVQKALWRMEIMEQYAKVLLTARLAGTPRPLPEGTVQELLSRRGRYGLAAPACQSWPSAKPDADDANPPHAASPATADTGPSTRGPATSTGDLRALIARIRSLRRG